MGPHPRAAEAGRRLVAAAVDAAHRLQVAGMAAALGAAARLAEVPVATGEGSRAVAAVQELDMEAVGGAAGVARGAAGEAAATGP